MAWARLLDPNIRNPTLGFIGQRRPCCPPGVSFSSTSNVKAAAAAARRFPWSACRCLSPGGRRPPPVSMTTKAEDVDVVELSALLAAAKQNCEQFPSLLSDGSIVPVNPAKLRHALRHSTVVVGLYVDRCESGDAEGAAEPVRGEKQSRAREFDPWDAKRWLNLWKHQRDVPRSLIAFGRATSDRALTASIYDLVVSPPFQRLGLGSRVLLKIVKDLKKRGIFDIAVTHSPELRPFFEHCGFGPDALESITMMYTRGPSSHTGGMQVKEIGRKTLVIPPARAPFLPDFESPAANF